MTEEEFTRTPQQILRDKRAYMGRIRRIKEKVQKVLDLPRSKRKKHVGAYWMPMMDEIDLLNGSHS